MTIREKLEQFDLFDQAITRHGIMEYIRDYEVMGYLCGAESDIEVQFIFKGCLKSEYKLEVDPKGFSMDERLLDLERQDEIDYPQGFVWGVKHAVVYPGWTLKEETQELKHLEDEYNIKLYEIYFDTNTYDLTLIFHDLEIRTVNKITRSKHRGDTQQPNT